MLTASIKRTAFLLCLPVLAGCSLFSSQKDLPEGERIAVLAAKEKPTADYFAAQGIHLPAAVMNYDWPQNGYNANHLVGNLSGSIASDKIWSADFGDGSNKRNILITKPVISQHLVFAQDVEGTVSAFDLLSGKKIWKQKIKPQVKNEAESGVNGSGLAAAYGYVFATTGFGSVVAFEAKTGSELWRVEVDSPLRTSPTVCGNKLIVQTIDNRLFAYNVMNGQEIWRYNVPAEDTVLAGNASPACDADKNLLIAGFSNGELEALNANIGYPLWSVSMVNEQTFNSSTAINAIKAPAVIDGDVIYAIGNNDSLAAIDYRTGEKIWERQIGGVNMPWVVGDYVYVLSNANSLTALNKADGKVLWNTPLSEDKTLKEKSNIFLTGPMMVNGKLLVTASDGMIYALSAATGEIVGTADIGYKLSTSPIVAEDIIIFQTDDAHLIAYK